MGFDECEMCGEEKESVEAVYIEVEDDEMFVCDECFEQYFSKGVDVT